MKKNEKVETVKATTVANEAEQKWTRHIHTYYIYDQTKGFLMKDKTFQATGDVYTFNNITQAKTVCEFVGGKVLMVVD